jgi:integrase
MSATEAPGAEESRTRLLSDDELRELWAGRGASSREDAEPIDPMVHAYLRLLVLCGTRRGETGVMDWANIDLEDKVWSIPAEARKNRQPLKVPLSAAAVGVLKGLGPRTSGRVFPPNVRRTRGA